MVLLSHRFCIRSFAFTFSLFSLSLINLLRVRGKCQSNVMIKEYLLFKKLQRKKNNGNGQQSTSPVTGNDTETSTKYQRLLVHYAHPQRAIPRDTINWKNNKCYTVEIQALFTWVWNLFKFLIMGNLWSSPLLCSDSF